MKRSARMSKMPKPKELREVIEPHLGGARLERVLVLHKGKEVDMFVVESCLLKELPRSERATAIYRHYLLKNNPEMSPESLPFIAGPAVLFDEIVWN
jgi:hypothetical protein